MSRATGRYHASGYPSLSSVTCAPCRWVTKGTGPRYGPGVDLNSGRMSRPEFPPGGLAQCSVGSMGSRCGRKLPVRVTSWLTHVTRTGRFARASMTCAGYWNVAASAIAPYPNTAVRGNPGGRICCENWRTAISYRSTPGAAGRACGITGRMNKGVTYLGIDSGGSVPPGTGAAPAERARNAAGTSNAAPVTVPAWINCRRVSIDIPQSRKCQSTERVGRTAIAYLPQGEQNPPRVNSGDATDVGVSTTNDQRHKSRERGFRVPSPAVHPAGPAAGWPPSGTVRTSGGRAPGGAAPAGRPR